MLKGTTSGVDPESGVQMSEVRRPDSSTELSEADEVALVEAKAQRDADNSPYYTPGYALVFSVAFLSILGWFLYGGALWGHQYGLKPLGCATDSSSTWPSYTESYFSLHNNDLFQKGIHTNENWYFGSWYFLEQNEDDSLMCSDQSSVCVRDGLESDLLFIGMGLDKVYNDYQTYIVQWPLDLFFVLLCIIIQIGYACTVDALRSPPSLADEKAWFQRFKPVKNHFSFDYVGIWKALRSIYYVVIVQLIATVVMIIFIARSMATYSDLGRELTGGDAKLAFGKFFAKDADTNYCESVEFQYSVWGYYCGAIACAVLCLAIEVPLLCHFYVKAHNGGVFHYCINFGEWAIIEEST